MGRGDENLNSNSDIPKSLLKKPGTKTKTNNRVVFNENKNEFFDADYIILIREECEHEDDDNDDEICICNEMAPRSCCESNGTFGIYEHLPQSPKFAPPIEFVDVVTLSPPEGYKDMELENQEIMTLRELSSNTTVCKECTANKTEEKKSKDDCKTLQRDIGKENNIYSVASPVTGILKGGLFWKHHENNLINDLKNTQNGELEPTSDKENTNERAVHFMERNEDVNECNGKKELCSEQSHNDTTNPIGVPTQETTEMMVTFKFGKHVLVSNNSLKPNSAVRQLFPTAKTKTFEYESSEQLLVNTDEMGSFDETKTSKLSQNCEKKILENSNLRRSLISYEPRPKRSIRKEDNSLVERIKLLTCDLDQTNEVVDKISQRIAPNEELSQKDQETSNSKNFVKNISPSSSSTTSSNSSSISSTYKKITDLFGKKEKQTEMNVSSADHTIYAIPNLGELQNQNINKCHVKINTVIENKNLFSTLVPITACVNPNNFKQNCYNINSELINATVSSSSTNREYVTESFSEITVKTEESKVITPDVLAGTPSMMESIDEPVYKQQDTTSIGRIKNMCRQEDESKKEDDEHDDYGFNRRPCVQGVKQKFGATTNILHQIQNHIEVSDSNVKLTWPYYSDSKYIESNRNTKIEEIDAKISSKYPFKDNIASQNYHNKKLREEYNTHSAVIGIEVDYNEYCLPQPKNTDSRPMSPPPKDFTKNYHTMVYIPYNHLENCRPFISNHYHQSNEILKLSKTLNPQQKKYDQYIHQQSIHNSAVSDYFNIPVLAQKPGNLFLDSNHIHLSTGNNSEVYSCGQTSAKSTQTLAEPLLTCSYIHNSKCKSMSSAWKKYDNCNIKNNQQNMPSKKILPNHLDNTIEEGMKFNCNKQFSNENEDCMDNFLLRTTSNASSVMKCVERGAPEGAVSVAPIVSSNVGLTNNIATSPSTSHFKCFYAMNV